MVSKDRIHLRGGAPTNLEVWRGGVPLLVDELEATLFVARTGRDSKMFPDGDQRRCGVAGRSGREHDCDRNCVRTTTGRAAGSGDVALARRRLVRSAGSR